MMSIFINAVLCLYALAFFLSLASAETWQDIVARVYVFLVPLPLLSIPLWLVIWLIRLALGS